MYLPDAIALAYTVTRRSFRARADALLTEAVQALSFQFGGYAL